MARRDGGPNRRLAELVDPQPGEVILDVGCGPGLALATLARLQPEAVLTGVDVSPVMAAQARRRLAGLAQVIAAPVESLPFPTASFDAACSLNSILFWTDEAAGLAELQRVLRPGGRLVVGVRTRVSTGTDDIGPTGLCPDGVAALRRRLEAAGFTVARVTEHTFADDRFAALHGLRS
jgi:ubiquinone/menaquinone biosynthesis C-methylase UbiE